MIGFIGLYFCFLRERLFFENVDLIFCFVWCYGLFLFCIVVVVGDSVRIISVDNLGISVVFLGFV